MNFESKIKSYQSFINNSQVVAIQVLYCPRIRTHTAPQIVLCNWLCFLTSRYAKGCHRLAKEMGQSRLSLFPKHLQSIASCHTYKLGKDEAALGRAGHFTGQSVLNTRELRQCCRDLELRPRAESETHCPIRRTQNQDLDSRSSRKPSLPADAWPVTARRPGGRRPGLAELSSLLAGPMM